MFLCLPDDTSLICILGSTATALQIKFISGKRDSRRLFNILKIQVSEYCWEALIEIFAVLESLSKTCGCDLRN